MANRTRALPRPTMLLGLALLTIALVWHAGQAHAALPNDIQVKLEVYKKKPVEWAADEIKPDPSTQIKSVHVSAPVLGGGSMIGVIHNAVTAE